MNRNFFLLFVVLFVLSTDIFPQTTTDNVEVRLSLADGKTVYRMGETIRLMLSFTANRDGYTLDQHTSKPAPSLDEVILSPSAGVFEWAKEYRRGAPYYNDVIINAKLSAAPTDLTLLLNNFVRFDKPGKYSVKVKTKRVSTGDYTEKNWSQLSLTTDEVNFEIKEMSEAEEEQEVKRLSALLDASGDWREQTKIAEQLSNLTGDASTREKVRRFFTSQSVSPGNYHGEIRWGLFIARNRALVIKLLEDALRDTNREANHTLLGMLSSLRQLQEEANLPITDIVPKGFFGENNERYLKIQQAYLKELVESLARRTGKNRTTTAIAILQSLPRENPPLDTLGKVREILLKEFDNLDILDREYLLSAYWEKLRDPMLLPSIERMLTDKNLPQTYSYNVRTTAIKRLIELDKLKARPFVVAEIHNPISFIDVDVLSSLDDKFLPEVDDALLEQIRETGQLKTKNRDYVLLRQKTLLAARYATAKIYDGLLEVYKSYGDQWFADAKGSLLGYFARHNDKEAIPLIEQALAKLGSGYESSFFSDLTKMNYPKGVDDFLRKHLAGDDSEAVSNAAYLMSKYGTEANKKLIQARYNRWLKEWSGRGAEPDAEETDAKINYQAMFQINMIEALIRAEAWKLPDAEIERLKQSCITEKCRQHFRIR